MIILLPLVLSFAATLITALVGMFQPKLASIVSMLLGGFVFISAWFVWLNGGGEYIAPWAPAFGLNFYFAMDGLAALYVLLATGIGWVILLYSAAYLPEHLKKEGHPEADATRFYAWLLLFMSAMVGMAMAQDMILLFIFWDLTAVTSYLLIGFDDNRAEARPAALMAILVTGITSVFFLIAALVLAQTYGTFSIPQLIQIVQPGPILTGSMVLIALAALAKSAQMPFHFWLPRAMAAPTPVSAYLHSAAMVAAGMFLLQRFYPMLEATQVLLPMLVGFGIVTMVISGILALTADILKQVLAYSTISQYAYVVFMLGMGGESGIGGAVFYVLAHALIKSSLFMIAGAVMEMTGERRLSRVGGLAQPLPLLAVSSGIVAVALGGLPLTVGFFKDDLFFHASLQHAWWYQFFAVLGAALTLAYIWRFYSGIFLGKPKCPVKYSSISLVFPIGLLAVLILAAGILPTPLTRLAEQAASASFRSPVSLDTAYHLDLRSTNLLTLAAYALAAWILLSRSLWEPFAAWISEFGKVWGPDRLYRESLRLLNLASDKVYAVELRDLGGRISSILVPMGALLILGLLALPTQNAFRVTPILSDDDQLLIALILTSLATMMIIIPKGHLTQVLSFSTISYALTIVFALFGGPDVALVTVLISSITTIFFFAIFTLFPTEVLEKQERHVDPTPVRRRQILTGLFVAGVTFLVVLSVLSQQPAQDTVAIRQIALAPYAHGKNVLTVILSDFRGLDTMGETTVVGLALLGVLTLLTRGKGKLK